MTQEMKAPPKLLKTQAWFGSIITRPVDDDNCMNPISPSGEKMEVEACNFIKSSPTLRPAERIQIYNQQYWWRLISIMQEEFPLLVRLFGYYDFNRVIAVPYLLNFPPDHWSLAHLGDYLPRWVESDYHADDKQLILDAAKVDLAFSTSFSTGHHKAAVEGGQAEFLEKRFYLQPHLCLMEFDYDIFAFRRDFMKEKPEHWVENDFPELKKDKRYYFVLFRNGGNQIAWKGVSPAEFALLGRFEKGGTIDEVCEWLENQPPEIVKEAESELQNWFQSWIVKEWIYPES